LNVTFFCELDESLALLLPNDSALLPPLCIWRMKTNQKPTMRSIGAQVKKSDAQGLAVAYLCRDADAARNQFVGKTVVLHRERWS
jgi:hypothetical protein